MEEQFVPYKLSQTVKDLGFDEKCLGFYYQAMETDWFDFRSGGNVRFNEGNPIILNYSGKIGLERDEIYLCKAPLWQQIFLWFDKLGLSGEVYSSAPGYRWSICKSSFNPDDNCSGGTSICNSGYEGHNDAGCYNTFEDARLACLEKLIETYKNQVL